ncbi:MAG: serine/threonine-protein kinase [Myxococcota bacterium]
MASHRGAKTNFLDIGTTFEEKYEIVKELGSGGFGMVYLAFQASMDRYVAIKMLKSGLGRAQHAAAERFLREVKIISKLRHPNTVTIHDFGEAEDGVLYMVLEYIEGETLENVLTREGAQQPRRALHIARQIAKSLAEAHRHGVVHRDLKPANVMLMDLETERDFVKVLDFGVARLLRTNDRDLTSAGLPEGKHELIGTPRYMSPEQVRGESLTPASDLYGLGLMLYELLVGEPAMRGETTMALISQQISPNPVRLDGLRALSPHLERVVQSLTDKNQETRAQSAAETVSELDRIIDEFDRSPPNATTQGKPHRVQERPLGIAREDKTAASTPSGLQSQQQPNTRPQPQTTGQARSAVSTQAPTNEVPKPDVNTEPRDALRKQAALGPDLPPEPTDQNIFSSAPEPEKAAHRGNLPKAPSEKVDDDLGGFTVGMVKIVLFGSLAAIGVYISFLTIGMIFGEFLRGQLRFYGALILAIAIPLLTALGENSQKERFEVVERPVDRIARVFIGTAIFSFGASILVCFAMSGQVVKELHRSPNWFMSDQMDRSKLGNLNDKFSEGLAFVVEAGTRAVGVYNGPDTGAMAPDQPAAKTRPTRPPEPTRPATRAADKAASDDSTSDKAAPEDSKPEERTDQDDAAAEPEKAAQDEQKKNRPPPSNDDRTGDDGEYIRW